MNPLFILELLTLLAAMAEDASHSDDIRPQIRALLPLFPGRSRASTLDEAITHDVLPNVPPGRIAAFVSDNLIDLAIALGVKPAPGSSKYHERGTLSRMDDGPHPLPRGVKGSLVAYQPWVAREILRRVADAPYVVTLASLRASSGDVYAHAFPDEKAPPGHIESLVSDLWQNLRFIAWHFDETGEDPRFVDYPTARAQTFTWLRFAPGVEAGDVVPETGHVVQTLPDGSFVTELRMTELGVAKGITPSCTSGSRASGRRSTSRCAMLRGALGSSPGSARSSATPPRGWSPPPPPPRSFRTCAPCSRTPASAGFRERSGPMTMRTAGRPLAPRRTSPGPAASPTDRCTRRRPAGGSCTPGGRAA